MFGKKRKNKETDKPSIVTRETVGLTLGVFCVLVLLISFTGSLLFGDLGIAVTSFLFGVFGFMTYFVFLSLLYLAVTLVIGRNFIPGKRMTVAGFCAAAFIGLLVHAVVTSSYPQENWGQYLAACFEAGNNGAFGCSPFGIVGGLLTYPFTAIATHAGAYILFVAAIGLCGYLFVNSLLEYKGIRIGPRKPKSEQNRESEQARQPQAKPISFEDLENNRVPQNAEVYSVRRTSERGEYSDRNAPLRGDGYQSQRPQPQPQPPVRQSYEDRAENVYQAQNGYGNILYDRTVPLPYAQKDDGFSVRENDGGAQFLSGESESASAYDRGRDILYGTQANPAEYRNRNLIFDTSSRYNNRPQNVTPAAPSDSASYANENAENDSYDATSYSRMYSKDIDGRNAASAQPRKIVQEDGSSAQSGYSMYRKDVFDNYNAAEEVAEPIRPSYKAPDSGNAVLPSEAETPSDSSVGTDSFPEPYRTSEPMSFRDRFNADRENRNAERTFAEPERRIDESASEERSVFDRKNIFDDGFDANNFEEEDDIPDFRTDERRDVRTDRSREGLSSAMRETRLPSERGEGESTPSLKDAPPLQPPARVDLTGRGVSVPERAVGTRAETNTPPPAPKPRVIKDYIRPSLDLFDSYADTVSVNMDEIEANKRGIMETLAGFNVAADVVRVTTGPSFTRYDITIPKNVTAKTIARYADNIAMSIHAIGTVNIYSNFSQGTIAIEVPNRKRSTVGMRTMLQSDAYINAKPGALMFCIGKDVEGKSVCGSLTKMTHMLVAGATGSGKSVFLNELIISLIMKYSPEELRLILIDPKQVEFAPYDKLPHLMINEIIADVNKVIVTLNWAINEMERRYTLFRQLTSAGTAVRNIDEYNAAMSEKTDKLPKLVIIVDELADLMSVAKKDIEDRISRIAAKARAAGIHLVLATQRPSVDVITGVLKSNLPSRFAFRVSAEVDSRVILDETGAENLLGAGDLLYKTGSMFGVERVQGAWLDSPEIQRVCDFIRQHNEAYYDESVSDFINSGGKSMETGGDGGENDGEAEPVYIDALRFVVQSGSASISMIQRKCSVGYNKAGKIIEWMEMSGYISPFDGAKSRKVLLSADEFRAKYGEL